jgi:hypothetical protein
MPGIRMNRRRKLWLIGAISCLSTPAQLAPQAAKPPVQVVFHVEAARYKAHYFNRMDEFSREAAKKLVARFREDFAFLDFTTDPQPVRLHVMLANRAASDDCMQKLDCAKETVLRLELEQPGQPTFVNKNWVWRYLDQNDYWMTLTEIAADVEHLDGLGYPKLDATRFVTDLLSHVQLAPTGHLLWEPPDPSAASPQLAGIAVPLPATLLCADQHSVLVLRSEIPQNLTQPQKADLAVDAQGPFMPPDNPPDETWKSESGNLFGVPATEPPTDRRWDRWDPMFAVKDKNQIRVTGVFMHVYRKMDTGCTAAIPPGSAELGPGGGQ